MIREDENRAEVARCRTKGSCDGGGEGSRVLRVLRGEHTCGARARGLGPSAPSAIMMSDRRYRCIIATDLGKPFVAHPSGFPPLVAHLAIPPLSFGFPLLPRWANSIFAFAFALSGVAGPVRSVALPAPVPFAPLLAFLAFAFTGTVALTGFFLVQPSFFIGQVLWQELNGVGASFRDMARRSAIIVVAIVFTLALTLTFFAPATALLTFLVRLVLPVPTPLAIATIVFVIVTVSVSVTSFALAIVLIAVVFVPTAAVRPVTIIL